MAETSGGLVKHSIQFDSEQMAWLRTRQAQRGQASIASVVRGLIDEARDGERQQNGEAA